MVTNRPKYAMSQQKRLILTNLIVHNVHINERLGVNEVRK